MTSLVKFAEYEETHDEKAQGQGRMFVCDYSLTDGHVPRELYDRVIKSRRNCMGGKRTADLELSVFESDFDYENSYCNP